MKIFFARTFAIALVLVLTATGLWAAGAEEEAPAPAADKKYVTDPTTGKVVSAPEYGGTITFAQLPGRWQTDTYLSHTAQFLSRWRCREARNRGLGNRSGHSGLQI